MNSKPESQSERNQAILAAIVDNTVDGMITIDQFGTVETYNKACQGIFGYSSEQVLGQNVKMLMPEPYHSEHDGYLRQHGETGEKKIIGIGREVEGRRQDGTTFPLDLAVSEVQVQGRKLYSGIVRDITERKEAEEQLKQANAELEEFAYRTSHDLRSPLVSAIGLLRMTEVSLEKGKTDVALRATGKTLSSLEMLESLIQDILTLTKTKNVDEEQVPVSINQLVEDALQKFSNMVNFENLEIKVVIDVDSDLFTKESRLRLIVENLISNAIKYHDHDKPQSWIQISARQSSDQQFVLEVKDNGIGIPADKRRSVFQMFKRFHPRVSFGSGLGLYMVKKSADILGGRVGYESIDECSVFRFEMPIEVASKSVSAIA